METLIGLPVLALIVLGLIIFFIVRAGQKNMLAKLIASYSIDAKSGDYQGLLRKLIEIKCLGSLLEKESKPLAVILAARLNEAFSVFKPDDLIGLLYEILDLKSKQRKAWLKKILNLTLRNCPEVLATIFAELSTKEDTDRNIETRLFLRWVIKANLPFPGFMDKYNAQVGKINSEKQ